VRDRGRARREGGHIRARGVGLLGQFIKLMAAQKTTVKVELDFASRGSE